MRSWLKLNVIRSSYFLLAKELLVVIAELLQDVFVIKQLLDSAIALRQQILDRLAALSSVVLPEV
jgi:hypothetical protein